MTRNEFSNSGVLNSVPITPKSRQKAAAEWVPLTSKPGAGGASAPAEPGNSDGMAQAGNGSRGGALLRLSLPCDLGVVRKASLAVRHFLSGHIREENVLANCDLALVEACNNAIIYANDDERRLPVDLYILCSEATVEIQVIDHTSGFDWPAQLELPEPEAEHGRGLFIIQSMMDETFYLRGRTQNRLVMRKQRGVPPAALPDSPQPEATHLGEMQHRLNLSEQVINTITQELCVQIASARQKEKDIDNRLVSHELEIARGIQQSLLPKSFPPLSGYELDGFCVSARQVGGDFYDVLALADDLTLLVVADVMGKGVPAALFAATLRTLIRTTADWTLCPSELLGRVNRLIYEELSTVDMFITAQLVLADTRQRRLTVASAGHCSLVLADGAGALTRVSPEGMPLGIIKHIKFVDEIVPLDPFHCALLYTDGLTEARNDHGEWFGEKRLYEWLSTSAKRRHTARQMSTGFRAELDAFQSASRLKDDQTLLALAKTAA